MASVAWRIVTAVRDRILALSIPDVPTAQVVIRKHAVHDLGFERAPQIVVFGEKEEQVEDESNNETNLHYPVLVLLVQVREIREAQTQWEMDARASIRKALSVTILASVPEVVNVEYDPQPAFSAASWGDAYDVSAQGFRYHTDETRT